MERMDQSGSNETSFLESMCPQGLMAFREILNIVLHLRDEEWMALTKDMTCQYTKLEFASLCTKIVISVSESVIGKMLPHLIERLGIESVLCAEAVLKKKVELGSRSHSATSGSSGERSPEVSDVVCNSVETAITKIKAAMQEAIQRVSSGQKSKNVADELNKSLSNISPDSDVKPETDDFVPLQNKANQAVSDMLVKTFAHNLTQSGLDPDIMTSSDAKDIIEIVVNGLVSAAEEDDDHTCPSGTSIFSEKPCLDLQDSAAVVPDAQKQPSKLLADVDRCTEEIMDQLEKLYFHEQQQATALTSFYKQESKGKLYMVTNAEVTSEESFVSSRSWKFLDKAALAVRTILLEKAVPNLLDNPITTMYDSGPYRSQFALKRGALDLSGLVVMILDQFYESMQSIVGDATNSSDVLASFESDAVDAGKEQPLQSPRTILKKVRSHLQEFLLKFSPEEIEEKEDDLVIDLCTEEIINEAVHLCRNKLTGPAAFTDLNILTSVQFQTTLSQRVREIILQKLDSCPSLILKESFSEDHLNGISYEISRSVSSTLQQFASSQLALISSSSSQISDTPLLTTPEHSSLFSPLCLFIEVQNKLKMFFSSFIEHSEKSDFTAQDMIREHAHILTHITAELLLKSHGAVKQEKRCGVDKMLKKSSLLLFCDCYNDVNHVCTDVLQPTNSSEEDLHYTSHVESTASRRFLNNLRKPVARIFSGISRACTSCVSDQSTLLTAEQTAPPRYAYPHFVPPSFYLSMAHREYRGQSLMSSMWRCLPWCTTLRRVSGCEAELAAINSSPAKTHSVSESN